MPSANRAKACYTAYIFVVAAAACQALPPTIGMASATGSFVLNSARIDGNANLYEGSDIKTARASGEVFLNSGATMTLGLDTEGTVYHDHLLLQRGATKVDNMEGFGVHAESFRIEQSQPASQAVVRIDDGSVQVAALSGSIDVFNRQGALLTHLVSGTASAFQADDNSSPRPNRKGGGIGRPGPNNNNRKKYIAATALLLAGTLAGLGLAVATITQTSPTSQ